MNETKALFNNLKLLTEQDLPMPVLFIGHGSPLNAIEVNEFTRNWMELGKHLPAPKAILCISAHWETSGTRVTAMEVPKTIHDFGGFPDELFRFQYPAPGSPVFAEMTASEITNTHIESDFDWGLDHGSWSVLCRMFPLANIPAFQLSLDYTKPPQWHYDLAKELQFLRKKGVLIIGSGNMVHNLRLMRFNNQAYEWAAAFDLKLAELIKDGNHDAIINYHRFGSMADLSVPTNEHFLPLLYTLALQQKNEKIEFFNDKNVLASISMRSMVIY